jgi:hypothetical protein
MHMVLDLKFSLMQIPKVQIFISYSWISTTLLVVTTHISEERAASVFITPD